MIRMYKCVLMIDHFRFDSISIGLLRFYCTLIHWIVTHTFCKYLGWMNVTCVAHSKSIGLNTKFLCANIVAKIFKKRLNVLAISPNREWLNEFVYQLSLTNAEYVDFEKLIIFFLSRFCIPSLQCTLLAHKINGGCWWHHIFVCTVACSVQLASPLPIAY